MIENYHYIILIFLAFLFGFLMTWGIGANDLANIMSTSIGSKSITIKQSLIIAIVFEILGAFMGGNKVVTTLSSNLININNIKPIFLIYGMLSVLLSSSIWMILTSILGLPSSVTNAIVGSTIGFGTIILGKDSVYWNQVIYIILSWISSPIISSFISYLIFTYIKNSILISKNPFKKSKKILPYYLFFIGIILNLIIFKKISNTYTYLSIFLIIFFSLIFMIINILFFNKILINKKTIHSKFSNLEKIFSFLMIFISCAMVFAHGSNDIPVAVAPICVIINLSIGKRFENFSLEHILFFLGYIGILIGLLTYGKNIIKTVGNKITNLTPSRAFIATLASSITIIVFTEFGIPVSTTQTLVGGILGVGTARGISALNINTVKNIFMSWIITIPTTSLLSIIIFYIFKILNL